MLLLLVSMICSAHGLRGVDPSGSNALSMYVPANVFVEVKSYPAVGAWTCSDGSYTLRANQLNDDVCDCSDGSDEPGTCKNPLFSHVCRHFRLPKWHILLCESRIRAVPPGFCTR